MENSKNTETIFDLYAQAYQDQFMALQEYQSSLDQFCQYIKTDSRVLDIGCGPGNISAYLLRALPHLKIFGIDLSSKMVELAKKNIPSGDFRKMDCRVMDRLEGRFDAMVCGFCLPYLNANEVSELFKKASVLLNPAGVFYLSTMVADHYKSQWVGSSQGGEQRLLTHYHQADSLRDILKNYGFSLLHAQQLEEQERDGTRYHDQILIARRSF